MRLSLENNYFDHISSSKMFTFNSNGREVYLLFPGGMYTFEIWHNPLNVSALDIGRRTMKKEKIHESRQMNLGSFLALGGKSHEIAASTLGTTACAPHYTT